ncbi:hypothetical protein AL475_15990 [Vibrio fluvialis]|uniref:hypothetical protein n=1 Tax=Vibrio fluvialis TaxID=676 RepID=UPI000CEB4C93|nr:hypothetical protein [Vibrio fluvialis]AVH33418.1 hypothetical protein AL475_15990 [Vibrio fluvialis]EKO3474085.1 hypothetical protein [Vibrio fluvialis]MBY8066265.1 hypothetical protein [Vibrio fluvialis]
MSITEILAMKKEHAERLSSFTGTTGEKLSIEDNKTWIERPKGSALSNLISALEQRGVKIKRTAFDAIAVPEDVTIDFQDIDSIGSHLDSFTFIEIKTTSKASVKEDFSGYFFAFTEGELRAAEQLGEKHQVALVNKKTESIVMSSVPELLSRAKSMHWQVSVQL